MAWGLRDSSGRTSLEGEEKDEIEGDDLVGAADDDDDEDSDTEDQDGGPVRKKVKTVKKEKIVKPVAPVPQQSQQGQNPQAGMPEKRKRGRPRNVPFPPVASSPITMQPMEGAVSVSPSQHQPLQQQAQPQQYFLAAFVFFSVLNSPLARSHHSTTRTTTLTRTHTLTTDNAHYSTFVHSYLYRQYNDARTAEEDARDARICSDVPTIGLVLVFVYGVPP